MNAIEIKDALKAGKKVFWHHTGYEVIKDSIGQYLIKCHMNDNYTGLTHRDGITLNGSPEHFYVGAA